jgi:hypothetical protein
MFGNQVGEKFGAGGLGLRGMGAGGGDVNTIGIGIGKYASARGGGGKDLHVPTVSLKLTSLDGALAKEVVHRIVARHINEVRYCYERELIKTPDLAGTVSVDITIVAGGMVSASTVASSTLKNHFAESCVANAFKRWEFPRGERPTNVKSDFTFAP